MTVKRRLAGLCALFGVAASAPAQASEGSVMYRCPGNEYSNTISAKDAKDRGCKTLDAAPVSVLQGTRPKTGGGSSGTGGTTSAAAPSASSTASPPTARVDPVAQRARDSDARTILESELRAEEERLRGLQKEFNNGQPERQGGEQNYQKYLDRVAEMRTAITRKEGDVAAIRRELGKLPK